jgi:hypothetical protein
MVDLLSDLPSSAEHWRLPAEAPMTIHFEPAGRETDAFWKVFFLETE